LSSSDFSGRTAGQAGSGTHAMTLFIASEPEEKTPTPSNPFRHVT
jgi:hypothetical protein